MLNTYDNSTLFQYFGQRPLSRKTCQYQLHSLCSTILNLFITKWWNRDYVVDTDMFLLIKAFGRNIEIE